MFIANSYAAKRSVVNARRAMAFEFAMSPIDASATLAAAKKRGFVNCTSAKNESIKCENFPYSLKDRKSGENLLGIKKNTQGSYTLSGNKIHQLYTKAIEDTEKKIEQRIKDFESVREEFKKLIGFEDKKSSRKIQIALQEELKRETDAEHKKNINRLVEAIYQNQKDATVILQSAEKMNNQELLNMINFYEKPVKLSPKAAQSCAGSISSEELDVVCNKHNNDRSDSRFKIDISNGNARFSDIVNSATNIR